MEEIVLYKNKRIVYYYDYLENPLVCLHGLNLDSSSINMERNRNVIKIDLPGYGKSEFINDLTINDVSNIINLIASKLNIKKFNLCGFCLGSIFALDYCLKYPEKVNNLYLFEIMIIMPKWLYLTNYRLFKIIYDLIFSKKIIKNFINKLPFFRGMNWLNDICASSKKWNLKVNKQYLILMNQYEKINHQKRCLNLGNSVYIYQVENTFKEILQTSIILSKTINNSQVIKLKNKSHFEGMFLMNKAILNN